MIGKKIKERREELGLSQEQLANMLGVSKSAISNYETNVSSPKETILLKLFYVLQCDANYFYEDYLNDDVDFSIYSSEKKLIQKYRQLDTYGKKLIDCVLDFEHERCTAATENEDKKPKTYITKVAARNGGAPEERERTQEEIDEIRSRPDADWDR